jgi:hypothetical protein
MKRNIVLLVTIIGTVLLYAMFNTRELGICNGSCGPGIDKYQDIFLFSPIILVFSLLTYKMKNVVFLSWWKFAKWAIPVIFFLLYLINIGALHPGLSGGVMGMGDIYAQAADLIASISLYIIFVTGSLIQIYRGWNRKLK